MDVALFGGSFNPPHVGHAMVASWIRWTAQADEVWWVPVAEHAFAKQLAPFELRVQWCRDLLLLLPSGMKVSTIEAERPGPSYTIHTLDALGERHPGVRFRWVVGADVVPQLSRWHEADRLQRQYPPLVVGRGGYPAQGDVPVFPAVSSTAIRRALGRGEVPEGWLLQPTARWFRDHESPFGPDGT